MTDWINWLVLAGAVVILEIFSGTFYLLMIAIGLAAGGLAAWLGAGNALQFGVAAVVGVIATYALRHSRFGKIHRPNAARDPNVNMDIGQTIGIGEWNSAGGKPTARAIYRGAMWDVELEHGATAEPGLFIIREMRGSRLIVAGTASHDKSQSK